MTVAISAPVIETERLILRGLGPEDLPYIQPFYGSERSRFVGGPVEPEQSWRVLAAEIGHWTLRGFGRWGVDEKATGRPMGLVGLWCPEGWPEPEIGWDLWDGAEGKGYATEAALAARGFAYGTLGWSTAISLIAPPNEGSKGVARRMGAAKESDFQHPRFGHLEIWRHQAAADVMGEG